MQTPVANLNFRESFRDALINLNPIRVEFVRWWFESRKVILGRAD
jgi:hypothetical protein